MLDQDARRELAQRVRAERQAQRLTQRELATKAGVSLGTVNNLERGESVPQAAKLALVLDALGLDPDGETLRQSWPADIQVFTDMLSAFLATMDERERRAVMREITQHTIGDH